MNVASSTRSSRRASRRWPRAPMSPPAPTEAIPQLRANENMLSLQEELGSTENRIAFARQHYNDSVMQYNTALESVPSNIVAGIFGFRSETLFAAEETERQPVL